MKLYLALVLFFLLCSNGVRGIGDSGAKSTEELDLLTKTSYSRKILQISPFPSPIKKHHHHHHHKHTNSQISPSPSPSPSLSLHPTAKNPKSKSHNHSLPVNSSSLHSSQLKHTKSWTIYILIIGAISFALLFSILLFLCIRAKKVVTVKPWTTGLSGQLQKAFVKGVPALKRVEIENACEYFSNIIGSLESNCTMYKGTLSSGVEIAVVSTMVKSAKDWSKHREFHFRKKITNLSKVNHKNFVNLLGFCEESKPFSRMMVFEYAPNGTLFEHLHNKEMENLDWSTRLRIAVGIAYCLNHIHQLDPPVTLTSLDSSTIYLTDDFAAKVSDLSLCTGTKDDNTLDKETIVYKYGLVLLEIISGKPYENWGLNKPLKEIIDKSLEYFEEKKLEKLYEVIRECVDLDAKKRPSMKEVARMLREITEMPPDGAVPKLSPLWWAELEILSPAAD